MKIAILSDIHSNIFALEAVLDDAKRRGANHLFNLGDILYGPIAPKATYDLLRQHDFVTIRGNQDRQIYDATAGEISANPTMQFILDDLGGMQSEAVEWMRSLPFDHQFNDDIYLCHGTPADDLIYLLENVETGGPVLRSDMEIKALIEDQTSKIILCGHTHIPRTVAVSSGQTIINPGSIGLPAYEDDMPYLHAIETYSPMASYAILEKSSGGYAVSHIKVPYDYESASACAAKRGRSDRQHYLSTGRKLSQ
ncbi:metallophosphoesterase [Kordiimonas sp. SCSIO 12610]|uniref:metallophosphoesterase family protein n=1 Tax=Kordiimonas sp. SCSIO 12610 TaxID=2829597 RepID=UPI00210D8DE5|nr:metallophosphoesterase family protein [Kordiimonas sp. SCSIO 12610]UTW56272.1 metallophosphoesterase family protein [Kordiimonas sp. SCSIO 12610]